MFIVLFGLSACYSSGPYVFKEGEFNRNSPSFNKVPDDIDKVQICYNKYLTTPKALQEMAQAELHRFEQGVVVASIPREVDKQK